jgi:hypothetical protein
MRAPVLLPVVVPTAAPPLPGLWNRLAFPRSRTSFSETPWFRLSHSPAAVSGVTGSPGGETHLLVFGALSPGSMR